MKELDNQNYIFKEQEVLSLELDKNILDKFKKLVYDLEGIGVYMDFMWKECSQFTDDGSKILHIVKNNIKVKWEELSEECYEFYKSNIVTVDLKSSPEIYFIFAPIILNKMTSIVFDFYEGADDIYISFFKNKSMQKFKNDHDKTYEITEVIDDLEVIDFIEEIDSF